MTRIYEPVPVEGFEWVLPVDDADFDVFREFDGTPRYDTWSPIRMEIVSKDEFGHALREADLPWLGAHAIVGRRRVLPAIGDLLENNGEVLPLECDRADLWVLNVSRIIDALDEDRSELVRFGSGRVMKVESPVFRDDALTDAQIFKIPQVLRGPTYFNEEAASRVQSAEFKGIDFHLVFES